MKTKLTIISLLFVLSANAQGFEEAVNPYVYHIYFALGVLVSIYITRLIFSVGSFLKYQKAHTLLLMKIARAQGVPEDEINVCAEIINPDPNKAAYYKTDESLAELDKAHLRLKKDNS